MGSLSNSHASRGEFCIEDGKPKGTGAVGPGGREGIMPLQANFFAPLALQGVSQSSPIP